MRHVLAIAVVLAAARVAAAEPACARDAAALRAALVREAHHAREWNVGWGLGYTAATAGQLGLAAARWNPLGPYDHDFRWSLYVGAGKSAIGALGRVVTPLRIAVPAEVADPCADLAALRAAEAEAARHERATFWTSHLGSFVVNLAGTLVLGERASWSTAAVAFAIGYPIGLVGAYTLPRRSWHAWRELQAAPVPLPGGGLALTVGGRF